jgi:excinuclease UvrABC nuclease subunit
MEEYTYIYTLSDPINNEVRYVGKSDNIEKRYKKHITEYRNRTHKEQWIKGLKDLGYFPILEIIDYVPKNN